MPKYTSETLFTPEIYAKPELLGRNELIWNKVLDYKLDFKKGLEMLVALQIEPQYIRVMYGRILIQPLILLLLIHHGLIVGWSIG